MTTIDSELILNPGTETLPFWPTGQTRLIVVFEILDDGIIARGLDPDKDVVVFKARARLDQKDAFRAAVVAGREGTLIDTSVSNQNATIDRDVVVVGGPGPGDGGPKYRVSLVATGQAAARVIRTRR